MFKPTRPMVRDQRGWNAQNPEMLRLLGLPAKAKLPEAGMAPRYIQGIKVWINPIPEGPPCPRRLNPGTVRPHRIMAQCPLCAKAVSAGRLFQHVCKGTL
jgi:hypothetical protein